VPGSNTEGDQFAGGRGASRADHDPLQDVVATR